MNVELTLAGGLIIGALLGCAEKPPSLANADYTDQIPDTSCRELNRENSYQRSKAPGTLDFILRAPQNFDPLVRHPLVVVFPPAGHNAERSELFSDFTTAATARGFIVLYPGHQRLNENQIERLGALVSDVSNAWCVDKQRVFFTGHSDGGTAAHVLALRDWQQHQQTQQPTSDAQEQPEMFIRPVKIAPSAAGVRADDLSTMGCGHQTPVMIMHGATDKLFPGFGQSARNWWLDCNQCKDIVTQVNNECEIYSDCANSHEVIYCESPGGHRRWDQSREQIIDFFVEP